METFDWKLEPATMNPGERRLIEKLEQAKKRANCYLIVDGVCYSLLFISIAGAITFLPGRQRVLFSILCAIIAVTCVVRVLQKRWNVMTLIQFIERATGSENLLQAAWMGMRRGERLGFHDLITQRAWQVARRFEIPPPWPVRAFQTVWSFLKRKWRWILLGLLLLLLLALLLYMLFHWLNPGFNIGNGEQTKKQVVSSQNRQARQEGSQGSENQPGQGNANSQPDVNQTAQGDAGGQASSSSHSSSSSSGQGRNGQTADSDGKNGGTDEKLTDSGSHLSQTQLRAGVLLHKVEAIEKQAQGASKQSQTGKNGVGKLKKVLKSLAQPDGSPLSPNEIENAAALLLQFSQELDSGKPTLGKLSDEERKGLQDNTNDLLLALEERQAGTSSGGTEAGTSTGGHSGTGLAPNDLGKESQQYRLPELPDKSGGKALPPPENQKGGVSEISPVQIGPSDELRPAGRPPREYRKFLQTP